jgi:hypothetical protein
MNTPNPQDKPKFITRTRVFFTLMVGIVAGLANIGTVKQTFFDHKAISYELVSKSALDPSSFVGLQMLIDGKPLRRVDIQTVRVFNSGDQPVVIADFEGPLRLIFPGQIIKAAVAARSPGNLPAKISFDGNSVAVEPLLLNSGDSFSIQALTGVASDASGAPAVTSASDADATVSARIAGVKSIEKAAKPVSYTVLVIEFVLGTGTLTAFMALLDTSIFRTNPRRLESFILGIIVDASGVFILIQFSEDAKLNYSWVVGIAMAFALGYSIWRSMSIDRSNAAKAR